MSDDYLDSLQLFYDEEGRIHKSRYEEYLHVFEPWIPPPPAWTLDVGCADGYLLKFLNLAGYYTLGIDRSINYVRRCRKDKLHVINVMAEKLTPNVLTKAIRFDVVFCIETLEHCESPWLVVKNIRRVLRKGGIFILSVPNVDHLENRDFHSEKRNLHIYCFDKTHVHVLLHLNGFRVLNMAYWPDNNKYMFFQAEKL